MSNITTNKFDEKYEIRLALYEEIPEIMQFIDQYWKKGHILARDRQFFEYEIVVDGTVNFIIAKSRKTGKIEGILGILPCSKNKEKLDIWGTLWKTAPEAMPMLGMELNKRMNTIAGSRLNIGVGLNVSTALPLLGRFFHQYTAKMKHYYRLADIDNYLIAKVEEKVIPTYRKDPDIIVTELLDKKQLSDFFDFSTVADVIPYKDAWYYGKRFFDHPVYTYQIWGITDHKSKAIMVTRIQKCNTRSVVRIVDFLGDQTLLAGCGAFFDSLLNSNEYIDFYFDGLEEDYVRQAGMISIEEYPNIIPNYFNPFEQTNVDIYVTCSNNKVKCLFFKADADQDRPN